jgi:hypothetical protein
MGDNTMKKIAGLLAFFTLAFAELALATVVITSTAGSVTAQAGSGPVRTVRIGDQVSQGDTIVTGPSSSVVMKFDDGQVAALTSNSRMTISAYRYDRATQRGNSLLSLVSGAMRAITGMIGKNQPENVAIRAATATIGIRGTDLTVVALAGNVYMEVNGGVVTFTFNGQTVTVDTGRAVLTLPNGTVSQGTINQILAQLQGSVSGRDILAALQGIIGLTQEINRVFPGIPTQGEGGASETVPGMGTGSGVGTPTGPTGIGGGGGGRPASPN